MPPRKAFIRQRRPAIPFCRVLAQNRVRLWQRSRRPLGIAHDALVLGGDAKKPVPLFGLDRVRRKIRQEPAGGVAPAYQGHGWYWIHPARGNGANYGLEYLSFIFLTVTSANPTLAIRAMIQQATAKRSVKMLNVFRKIRPMIKQKTIKSACRKTSGEWKIAALLGFNRIWRHKA